MGVEKTTREMIIETSRDVKWICKTLAEMKESAGELERRVRSLERWRDERDGGDRRVQRISAGAGGLVGGVAAAVVQMLLR
nr:MULTISPECIES: hypothetical protein [unclassified Methanoculleus]